MTALRRLAWWFTAAIATVIYFALWAVVICFVIGIVLCIAFGFAGLQ